MSARPIELILARNLMSSISTPAFLVDVSGTLVFFNEAAGAMLGRRFEESGAMTPEQWGQEFGPFDHDGEPVPLEELPLTIALRENRPAHARFTIHSLDGTAHRIEVSALPLIGTGGFRGAMAIFWPSDDDAG
ncbi:MAG TPA: hypothetical protein VHE14_07025, partial [Solirubrobacteraceae bacterium]|nr:hypothetical protein [Solirubrobacteraceae bacterium]